MTVPTRIIDLIVAYIISVAIVGAFYAFGGISDPIIYNVSLRLTGAMLVFVILDIVIAVSLDGNEQKNTFFQKCAPDITGENFSKMCYLAMMSPGAVCVLDCVILKLLVYGL